MTAMTVVINGTPYKLDPADSGSLSALTGADRQQLMALLSALQRQDRAAEAGQLKAAVPATAVNAAALKPERMGSGDVDALMAQLIQEDKNDRSANSGIGIKWPAIIAGVIFLLWLIF